MSRIRYSEQRDTAPAHEASRGSSGGQASLDASQAPGERSAGGRVVHVLGGTHLPSPAPPGGTKPEPTAQSGGGLGELSWGTKRRQGLAEALAKQAVRTTGSEIGKQILRGVLGGILGGSRRR